MNASPVIDFRAARVDSGEGARLIDAMQTEITEIYEGGVDLHRPDMPSAGVAELGPPHGVFLIGWSSDEAVCCGGLKRLDARHCEIKRMYVAPSARGHGLARRLLGVLEDAARERGYAVARLDSGSRLEHAIALYRSAGYREIENFNANPVAEYWAEKPL